MGEGEPVVLQPGRTRAKLMSPPKLSETNHVHGIAFCRFAAYRTTYTSAHNHQNRPRVQKCALSAQWHLLDERAERHCLSSREACVHETLVNSKWSETYTARVTKGVIFHCRSDIDNFFIKVYRCTGPPGATLPTLPRGFTT